MSISLSSGSERQRKLVTHYAVRSKERRGGSSAISSTSATTTSQVGPHQGVKTRQPTGSHHKEPEKEEMRNTCPEHTVGGGRRGHRDSPTGQKVLGKKEEWKGGREEKRIPQRVHEVEGLSPLSAASDSTRSSTVRSTVETTSSGVPVLQGPSESRASPLSISPSYRTSMGSRSFIDEDVVREVLKEMGYDDRRILGPRFLRSLENSGGGVHEDGEGRDSSRERRGLQEDRVLGGISPLSDDHKDSFPTSEGTSGTSMESSQWSSCKEWGTSPTERERGLAHPMPPGEDRLAASPSHSGADEEELGVEETAENSPPEGPLKRMHGGRMHTQARVESDTMTNSQPPGWNESAGEQERLSVVEKSSLSSSGNRTPEAHPAGMHARIEKGAPPSTRFPSDRGGPIKVAPEEGSDEEGRSLEEEEKGEGQEGVRRNAWEKERSAKKRGSRRHTGRPRGGPTSTGASYASSHPSRVDSTARRGRGRERRVWRKGTRSVSRREEQLLQFYQKCLERLARSEALLQALEAERSSTATSVESEERSDTRPGWKDQRHGEEEEETRSMVEESGEEVGRGNAGVRFDTSDRSPSSYSVPSWEMEYGVDLRSGTAGEGRWDRIPRRRPTVPHWEKVMGLQGRKPWVPTSRPNAEIPSFSAMELAHLMEDSGSRNGVVHYDAWGQPVALSRDGRKRALLPTVVYPAPHFHAPYNLYLPTTPYSCRCISPKVGSSMEREQAKWRESRRQRSYTAYHERLSPRLGERVTQQREVGVTLKVGRSRYLPSTLPHHRHTDRVRLAQFYRKRWTKEEKRREHRGRQAVWETRCALLGCLTMTYPF